MIRPCLFRVDNKLDNNLSDFLDTTVNNYMSIKLYAWKEVYNNPNKSEKELKKLLSEKFNIKSRYSNSITKDVIGTYKSNLELNKLHLSEVKDKIKSYTKNIKTKQETVDKLKIKAANNQLNEKELENYRKKKFKLYNMKRKLNNLKIKLNNLNTIVSKKKVSLCFGSKVLFKKQYFLQENGFKNHKEWLESFRLARLKTIHYIGSCDESYGNQICYLEPTSERFIFNIYFKDIKSDSEHNTLKYIGRVKIKHDYDLLVEYLNKTKKHNDKYGAVTIYFRKSKKGWYGSVLIDKHKSFKIDTYTSYGTLGIDFNVGFVSITETDKSGNILNSWDIPIRNNTKGYKGKNSLLKIIDIIMKYAHSVGKSVVIENLNFLRKKAKLCSGFNKNYNRMLSNFNYSFYIESMESSAKYNNVELIKVNPWNTSKAGKTYQNILKMSVHKLAAWQIARLGMGMELKYYKQRNKHSLVPSLIYNLI